MNQNKFNKKERKSMGVKYFIFNAILFCAFFFLGINGASNVKADVTTPEYTVKQSNHKGNKDSYNAYNATSNNSSYSNWYIQGTGIANKDTFVVELKIPYRSINGIIALETRQSGSGAQNYDLYKKDQYGVWASNTIVTSDNKNIFGSVVATANAVDANSALLISNGGTNWSLMYITEDTTGIVITYAYVLRNGGYGAKTIRFIVYNDAAYTDRDVINDPSSADYYDVELVVSKPISEFQDGGFEWISQTGQSTTKTSSGNGSPETDKIRVEYINKTDYTNISKDLQIILPKELAYLHIIGEGKTIADIKNNSIYATNTFSNVGSSEKIIYYYYNFMMYDYVKIESSNRYNYVDSSNSYTQNNSGEYLKVGNRYYLISSGDRYNLGTTENAKEEYDYAQNNDGEYLKVARINDNELDSRYAYEITLSVDANGKYVFYIKDVFENTFTSSEVEVMDTSKTDITIDYTNACELNIMQSTCGYEDSDWKKN